MRLSHPGPPPWPGTGRFTDFAIGDGIVPGLRPAGPGRLPHPVTQNGEMSAPVLKAETLVTTDGVPIDAIHLPGGRELAIVMAHGFTLSWSRPFVWKVARRLNQWGGVVTFDFRGHGRSGGMSTMGDREINDLDVAVAYARELGYRRVAAVGFSMGALVAQGFALCPDGGRVGRRHRAIDRRHAHG